MNEKRTCIGFSEKGVLSAKKHWICWKEWQKPRTRNQINKAAAEVSADKTNNDFLKKLKKPTRKVRSFF